MSEKVIHEVRVVETEDGYRIEIKGDKERLKEMGFGKGFPFGMGRMGAPFGHHQGHHGGFPFGRRPWWTESDVPEREQSDKA